MGHKSGADHSGARGKRPAMAHPSLVASAEEALADFRQGQADEAREYAQTHKLAAVKKIVNIMRSKKTPRTVARSCARDIIEIADGKVGGIQEKGSRSGGLTINILNLTDGKVEPKQVEKVIDQFADDIIHEELEMEPAEQASIREPDFSPRD